MARASSVGGVVCDVMRCDVHDVHNVARFGSVRRPKVRCLCRERSREVARGLESGHERVRKVCERGREGLREAARGCGIVLCFVGAKSFERCDVMCMSRVTRPKVEH